MLRAAALAVAGIAVFVGVMYLRFEGDTVPASTPTPLTTPNRASISELCESYPRVPKPPQCGPVNGLFVRPTVPPTPKSAAPTPEVREQLTNLRAGRNIGRDAELGRIAFVRGDDIWVKELAGGEERRLTDDQRNTAPRWSADGKWIAFQKRPDNGFGLSGWVVSAEGGSQAKVADEAFSLSWSPVNSVLAYTGGGFINTLNLDTGERRALARAGHFAWSPDGLNIAFGWSEDAGGDGSMCAVGFRVYGTVCQVRQGLSVVNAEGSGARRDVYEVTHQSTAGPIPYLHCWSRDGRYLSFWQEPIDSSSISADGAPLFVIPVDGGEPRELGRTLLDREGIITWSPNGSQIAFVDGGGRDIWIRKHLVISDLTGAGTAFRNDDGTAELNPAWSPQGDVVAFSRGEGRAPEDTNRDPEPAATRRIWLGDSAGRVQQLTSDATYSDNWPTWSSGGSYILFVRVMAGDFQGYGIRSGANIELWLMNADGKDPRKAAVLGASTPEGYYGFIHWDDLFDWYGAR